VPEEICLDLETPIVIEDGTPPETIYIEGGI
jgi:hypothetical protein